MKHCRKPKYHDVFCLRGFNWSCASRALCYRYISLLSLLHTAPPFSSTIAHVANSADLLPQHPVEII
ncbi:hypothetical protein GQ55_3G481300 [Panicum hallii var. hallii]|uniref:Uncharacterized protein n=1 Tax=Panicum hallii var. hallii TaxID=1504633 RepID=A0A2T7EJJ8_9POAL|nr:hypothetical protein GQ55_3G481300 [Panicum hallii var. hallii]